jgi:hypothetical protein
MVGFAAQRLMESEVESLTGAAHGERSPERINDHRCGEVAHRRQILGDRCGGLITLSSYTAPGYTTKDFAKRLSDWETRYKDLFTSASMLGV